MAEHLPDVVPLPSNASRWRKLRSLTSSEKVVLAEAAAILAVVSVGFRCVGVRRSYRFVARLSRPGSAEAPSSVELGQRARRIGWLVRVVGGRMPGVRCLERSVATLLLLRRAGIPSELRIGVRRVTATSIEAHAWIEHGGEPLGEPAALGTFTAFDQEGIKRGLLEEK